MTEAESVNDVVFSQSQIVSVSLHKPIFTYHSIYLKVDIKRYVYLCNFVNEIFGNSVAATGAKVRFFLIDNISFSVDI